MNEPTHRHRLHHAAQSEDEFVLLNSTAGKTSPYNISLLKTLHLEIERGDAEIGFRYTPLVCFDQCPFPWPPNHEPQDSPLVEAIAEVARELVGKRDAWLNPPNASLEELNPRTLTNLYNARPSLLAAVHREFAGVPLAAPATRPGFRATSAGDDPPQSRTFCPAFVHLCRGLLHPGGQPGRWWGNPAQVLTGTARGAPGQSVSPVCLQEKARFLETAWVLAIGSVPSLCIGRCRSAACPESRFPCSRPRPEKTPIFG
jgi:hypothetical protein